MLVSVPSETGWLADFVVAGFNRDGLFLCGRYEVMGRGGRRPGAGWPRKSLEELKRSGTFRPSRHANRGVPGTNINESDPATWFVHCPPHEQRLWARYRERYIPGDRLACYRFISWQWACESSEYWRKKRGPIWESAQAPDHAARCAARLADLFAATKWRRR